MIKEIEYKGMTAASSDYSCADGELDVSLSVDTSNGEGQAEYSPSTEFTLPSAYWRVMVIHETADYKHYILANTEAEKTHYLSYIDADDATKAVVGIDNNGKYIASGWVIKSVTPMGNTLVVTSENPETEEGDMCYFLWRNGKYVALGSEIPDVALQFNLSARGKFYSQQIYDSENKNGDTTKNIVNNGTFKIKITGRPNTGVCDFTEAQQDEVSSYVSGRVARFVNEVGNKAGRFIYPFFARYAYRLYDGTYTMQSAPVLMCPCSGTMPIVVATNNIGDEGADNMANGDIFATPCVLGWAATDSDALTKLQSDWKDIVQEVCIFVSPPVYTYDQSKKPTGLSRLRGNIYTWTTPVYENLMLARFMDGEGTSGQNTDYEDPEGYANDFYYRGFSDTYNAGIRAIEKEMAKDEDSKNTKFQWWDVYELFKMFYWGATQYVNGSSAWEHGVDTLYRIDLPEFDKDELQRKFKEESKFYLLKEYEVSEMTNSASIQHLDPQYLGALSAHEALPDDFLSHERKYPKVVRAYNSRLNIANITRYAYDGYPLASMFPRQTLFRDMAVLRDSDAKGKSGAEWLATVFKSPKDYAGTTTVRYTLETSSGKTIVVGNEAGMKESFRYVNLDDVVLSDGTTDTTITKTSRALPMFFYYPSPMCRKVEVFQDAQCILSAKMEEHSFLYGSFCLVGTAGDKDLPSSSTTQRTATALSTDKTIHLPNTVYLSEVNNPFSFLAVNAVTAGSGSIVGIVPAVEAVSQGQFGQYPMYALTDEGVWSLMPNDSGIYSTSRPVSRDVCNNPDSVLQVDHSVLFTTDRGIVRLAGSQSTCITDTLDSLIASKALSLKSLATYLTSQNISTSSLPSATFREFLKGASEVYDYTNRRIIVYNPTQTTEGSLKYAYAYVYYIKSNKWGLIPSSIVSATNSYPDAIVQDADGNVLNYSALDYTKTQPGVIVTRPLKLGEPGTLKTIVAVIQRGRFLKDHVAQILYGSNDMVNWYAVWSSNNMYMRGFSGTPYKYFRIVVHATLDTGETLDGCTVQFFDKMTDQPR